MQVPVVASGEVTPESRGRESCTTEMGEGKKG